MNFNKLMAELVCLANKAKLEEYSENLAIDNNGELIQEIQLKARIETEVSEIKIETCLNFDDNDI